MRNETLVDLSFLPDGTVQNVRREVAMLRPNSRIRDADVVVALQSAYHRHYDVASHNPVSLNWRPSVFRNPAQNDSALIVDTAKRILLSSSPLVVPTQVEYTRSLQKPVHTDPSLNPTGGRMGYTVRDSREIRLERRIPMREQ